MKNLYELSFEDKQKIEFTEEIILLLEKDINGDSISKKESAEDFLITACKPIIDKYYEIYVLFGRPKWFPSLFKSYAKKYGSFYEVEIDLKKREISFYWEDEDDKEYINLPFSYILDQEKSLKEYFELCRNNKLNHLEYEISNLKSQISNKERDLEKFRMIQYTKK